jgi:hypothetical protein
MKFQNSITNDLILLVFILILRMGLLDEAIQYQIGKKKQKEEALGLCRLHAQCIQDAQQEIYRYEQMLNGTPNQKLEKVELSSQKISTEEEKKPDTNDKNSPTKTSSSNSPNNNNNNLAQSEESL